MQQNSYCFNSLYMTDETEPERIREKKHNNPPRTTKGGSVNDSSEFGVMTYASLIRLVWSNSL